MTVSISRDAVESAADVICDWYCGTNPATCPNRLGHYQLAEGILGTVEGVWPHHPLPEMIAEPAYRINVHVPPAAADKPGPGCTLIEAIKEFERRSGAGWRQS